MFDNFTYLELHFGKSKDTILKGLTTKWCLSYDNQIKNTAGKLQSQKNIINKYSGTTWGAALYQIAIFIQ